MILYQNYSLVAFLALNNKLENIPIDFLFQNMFVKE